MKIKKMMPESWFNIDDTYFFRLENGTIAVNSPYFVCVVTTREDLVELITLDKYEKLAHFWRIQDKFYSLDLSSCIEINKHISFFDYYFSNNHSSEVYIKYFDTGKGYGIISLCKSRITNLISSEKEFTEISFEDDLFYAKDTKNKYHIIDINANELDVFATKCKKVPNLSIFYDDNKIYDDTSEVSIPDGIKTLEVVSRDSLTLLRISNENGIYFYSKRLEYLLGPIKNDQVESDLQGLSSCFIYETFKDKITTVFYVAEESLLSVATSCICKNLSCKEGIEVRYDTEYFFAGGTTLYHFVRENSEFLPILNDVNVDSYSICNVLLERETLIVALKNEKPLYVVKYFPENQKILKDGIEYICSGFEKGTYIYKDTKNELIFGIRVEKKSLYTSSIRRGKVIFHYSGINCHKIKLLNSTFDFLTDTSSIEVYSVEVREGIFKFFSSNGEKLFFRT